LRLYLWTINEINALKYAIEVQNTARNQIRVSHYKKQWRDRYIKPPSKSHNFEDPLKLMDKLVNNSKTYDHVLSFKKVLLNIVDDHNPQLDHNIHTNKTDILKAID
ncbi:unnamed protein product, partial [Medioppia subpectinata]